MSIFEHPWYSALLGDDEISQLWDSEAQLTHYIAFEAAYSRALGACGLVSPAKAESAAKAIETAQIDHAVLASGSEADGLPIPALIRALRSAAPDLDKGAIHTGSTSQDVMDTALALTVKLTGAVMKTRVGAIHKSIAALNTTWGQSGLMGRTRMQAALPITVSDRLTGWAAGLAEAEEQFSITSAALAEIQLGGPVGDSRHFAEHRDAMMHSIANELGLAPTASWHSNRARICRYANTLSLISGALGKLGQDVALMAQQGIDEVTLSGGGTSSAMPHKQNPIDAEILVSIARFNAAQLGGLHQALIHEQERSGAAWTLEWMILPEMAKATGGALAIAQRLLGKIERLGATTP